LPCFCARAEVVVQIDKSAQRMSVSVDGVTRYNWAVSTGRDGYGTPN
jgi:lipoprotein-anchoring transpeptidase ErfK/SrfK